MLLEGEHGAGEPKPGREETAALRRAMRDLVALSTLPAVWTGYGAARIAQNLADVLGTMLDLELLYLRVQDRTGRNLAEVARSRRHAEAAEHAESIGRALASCLEAHSVDPPEQIPDPFGEGMLRVSLVRFGHAGETGLLCAGSARRDFPTETDRLLLGIGANQAAVVLERKLAEEALRRSEQELGDFFHNAPLGLHWVGPDGSILRANRAELDLLGYPEEEYVGRHISEFHADESALRDILRRLQAGEELHDYEARLRCRDGSIRHVAISSNVLWENGRFVHTRCFTRDITDRKRAEQAREALNDRLATELADTKRLQELSAQLVREGDVGALHQRILEAAVGIMKSDMASIQVVDEREDALRLLAWQGFGPEFGRAFALIRPGTGTSCDVARQTGQRVIVPDVSKCRLMAGPHAAADLIEAGIGAVQSTPLVSRDGRMVGMISTHWRTAHEPGEHELRLMDVLARQAADLIESRQAEEALHRQTERLRLLWEAAAVLLTANDPDAMLHDVLARIGPHLGVDTYFNFMVNDAGDALQLASCRGIPAETARSINRLEFGQAICGRVAMHRQPIVATHIQQSSEEMTRLVKSFGIRAYACNPLMSGDLLLGTLSFATRSRDEFEPDEVAFLETICQYVTVAYERMRLLGQLQEGDRRKDEFLATLAHELRNPLAALCSATQVLRLGKKDEPHSRSACNVLERQLAHLTHLVDDLLDVSRITRNKLDLRKQRLELAEVVNAAVESSRPAVEQRGHEFILMLPPEPVYLSGDVVRLAQVFQNLLNNAARYTPPGGRIWLTAERHGDDLLVRVKDTGVGIPAEELPHLFEMFFQVDRRLERAGGGLGIGLSLVRRLVELHGGSVEASSPGPGKGSEFVVRLPVLVEASSSASESDANNDGRKDSSLKRSILVVDDNRDSADSFSALLRLIGNEVHTAYDGAEAVEAAQRLRPDVVLLDIGMPGLNGYDACRRIREQPWAGNTLLIALTGWGQDEDRRRTSEAGFDGHMVKPVDCGKLMSLISSLCEAPKPRIPGPERRSTEAFSGPG